MKEYINDVTEKYTQKGKNHGRGVLLSRSKVIKLAISTPTKLTLSTLGSKNTVKPAVAFTSIKRDPLISGHFRAHPNDVQCKCTFIKRAPVQRGQRSTKFAPKH